MQTSIVYEFALIAPYLHLLPTNFPSHLLYNLNCSFCASLCKYYSSPGDKTRSGVTGDVYRKWNVDGDTCPRAVTCHRGHVRLLSSCLTRVVRVESKHGIVCRETRISQSDTGRDYYKQMILSDTAIHTVCKHQLGFHVSYSLAQ